MTKHSPTPFTIQELPHRESFRTGSYFAIRDARNCCLALIGDVDAITDGDEARANADLFRAAPELLAILEKLIGFHFQDDLAKPEEYEPAFHEALRLIAKTKGEAEPI